MGDEAALGGPTASATSPVVPGGTNEDLLSQIFGGSSATTAPVAGTPTPSVPPANQKQKAIDDILGLFGSTSAPSPAPAPQAPVVAPALQAVGSSSRPATGAAQPAKAAAPGYVAYDKNNLKITFNPQVSAARPGVVLVSTRFEATGALAAEGLNFQVAVPKVKNHLTTYCGSLANTALDPAIANATHIEPRRPTRKGGNPGTAYCCPSRSTSTSSRASVRGSNPVFAERYSITNSYRVHDG